MLSAQRSSAQSSIFPSILPRCEHPPYVTPSIHFSLFKPTQIDGVSWNVRWNTPAVVLDDHMVHILHDDFPQELDGDESRIRRENEFAGIHYRVYLDPVLTSSWEPFQNGTIVDIFGANNAGYKYAVDCCQLERENNAYLKIVARSRTQGYLQPHNERPPFILVIPRALNNVDLHPNLQISRQSAQASIVMSLTDRADTGSDVQDEKVAAKKWFGCTWF